MKNPTADIIPKNDTRPLARKRKSRETDLEEDDNQAPRKMTKLAGASSSRQARKSRLVESINDLPLEDFIQRHVPSEHIDRIIRIPRVTDNAHDSSQNQEEAYDSYCFEIYSSSTIPQHYFDACFALIKLTSADAYRNSRNGWSPVKKKAEMRLPDMRYILFLRKREKERDVNDECRDIDDDLGGMLSFMTTYEDGLPVFYCYEIHLSPRVRRNGVGKHLMQIYEDTGRSIGLEKAMLTVYKSNDTARKFYEQLGFVEDEFSPKPMKLRNGNVREFDYMIMSKSLKEKKKIEHDSPS